MTNGDAVASVNDLLGVVEGEKIEFKEARNRFDFEKLAKYCCAFANEGGGKVVLGVTDRRPRRVVGTRAFPQPEDIRSALKNQIPLPIGLEVLQHPDGRVLVFEVPSRPVSGPLQYKGVYWSREDESLVPMSEDRIRTAFAESGGDFSAKICPAATLDDLDEDAVEEFRRRWMEKSGNKNLARLTPGQLLKDAELVTEDEVTYAALILVGKSASLGRLLPQAELVFEYRASERSGPAQQREEYRMGFLSFYDDLWATVNLRNELQHYQDGLFVYDVPTFSERPVREALLNAISHRDYQLGGNIFIRQYSRRLVVESPGGFPLGVTEENVLDRSLPRNRRIAETLARCGLVERSGQGMNLMFEESIKQGKLRPDFAGTDRYQVVLTLHGEVRDPMFLQFLEKVGKETLASFNTHDLIALDLVNREQAVPEGLRDRLRRLVDLGVVERVGRGRGARYLLSRRFYKFVGKGGVYTRQKGLDDETNKELLMKHLREDPQGSGLAELCQILPQLSQRKVQSLLSRLRDEGRVVLEGKRRWARWQVKDTNGDSGV